MAGDTTPEEPYHREPFAVDVSAGKTDMLYRAHGYHTKVPHRAIVPSILHYTKPGDVVLDGFCGSGMTGVAAQWCGAAPPTFRLELGQQWKTEGRKAPEWGARRVILGDLSPAATFIAANYNLPFDVPAFCDAAARLLKEVEAEIGWMYETLHTDGKTKGRINYTVWSEVFTCPECAGEVVFLNEALDKATKRTRSQFPCPHCSVDLTKDSLQRSFEVGVDPLTGETWGFSIIYFSTLSYGGPICWIRVRGAESADRRPNCVASTPISEKFDAQGGKIKYAKFLGGEFASVQF